MNLFVSLYVAASLGIVWLLAKNNGGMMLTFVFGLVNWGRSFADFGRDKTLDWWAVRSGVLVNKPRVISMSVQEQLFSKLREAGVVPGMKPGYVAVSASLLRLPENKPGVFVRVLKKKVKQEKKIKLSKKHKKGGKKWKNGKKKVKQAKKRPVRSFDHFNVVIHIAIQGMDLIALYPASDPTLSQMVDRNGGDFDAFFLEFIELMASIFDALAIQRDSIRPLSSGKAEFLLR